MGLADQSVDKSSRSLYGRHAFVEGNERGTGWRLAVDTSLQTSVIGAPTRFRAQVGGGFAPFDPPIATGPGAGTLQRPASNAYSYREVFSGLDGDVVGIEFGEFF